MLFEFIILVFNFLKKLKLLRYFNFLCSADSDCAGAWRLFFIRAKHIIGHFKVFFKGGKTFFGHFKMFFSRSEDFFDPQIVLKNGEWKVVTSYRSFASLLLS
jgi:hypothetical protein